MLSPNGNFLVSQYNVLIVQVSVKNLTNLLLYHVYENHNDTAQEQTQNYGFLCRYFLLPISTVSFKFLISFLIFSTVFYFVCDFSTVSLRLVILSTRKHAPVKL